ncbi:MAG: BamA/TamA family outer membrane protein [Prevotella sp.]|nr:BamA/TamA family outer membrane protein [Prevotella sp.]
MKMVSVLNRILALKIVTLAMAIATLSACSSAKYIPEKEYLLDKVEVKSDDKDFNPALLEQYVRLKGNSRWFSLFKIPLGIYAMAGRDTTKWVNKTLRNVGEAPVLYDTLQAAITRKDLLTALQNMGYMNAKVVHDVKVKGKKLKAVYTLSPGRPFIIRQMRYDFQDEEIGKILAQDDSALLVLHNGSPFTINGLEKERNRITALLLDRGYYKFHKEFIRFEADTMRGSRLVDVTMHILKYREHSQAPETTHPKYDVATINYLAADSTTSHVKRSVLESNTAFQEGMPYCASNVQRTYNNFSRLNAIRFTNLRFTERPDTTLLDCIIHYGLNKPSTISFQPEGTNTAGDLGAAVSLTYQNRNLFHGSELLSVRLRGAFEAITGLEGYQNKDYEEYGVETKISFPRFAMPFISRDFKRNVNASSELSFSYNLQNRPEFHRRVVSAGWRYRWEKPRDNWTYKWDAIDLNYIHMPWISPTFKHEYLDSVSNRNTILRYNYEDLFIMRTGMGVTFNNGKHAVKANVELGGNLLRMAAALMDFNKNSDGQYVLFDIAFAQYIKGDFDYTKVFHLDEQNTFVVHAGLGMAYPYGNSKILPFEKRYFSGGANSVRGWRVRGLGPGSFKGHEGAIDFINQTGDMKIDLNFEYRTHLFWKFNGAFFIDGGNIWTLREYQDQPGGQFKIDKFYKQIAWAYGLGLRFNFDYFILRFDMGMKAVNPAYDNEEEHYAVVHPDFSRDFSFHFAVGMPF